METDQMNEDTTTMTADIDDFDQAFERSDGYELAGQKLHFGLIQYHLALAIGNLPSFDPVMQCAAVCYVATHDEKTVFDLERRWRRNPDEVVVSIFQWMTAIKATPGSAMEAEVGLVSGQMIEDVQASSEEPEDTEGGSDGAPGK